MVQRDQVIKKSWLNGFNTRVGARWFYFDALDSIILTFQYPIGCEVVLYRLIFHY